MAKHKNKKQKRSRKKRRQPREQQRGPKHSKEVISGRDCDTKSAKPIWSDPETPRESKTPWPKARELAIEEGYRFLNPYNFVRYLPRPRITDTDTALLGHVPPPPHDRYVGLTGKITCRLTAKSPLFVSDSNHVEVREFRDRGKVRKHYHYRFFHVDGQDAIPATSLRGMIRAVFEAVTNSCFGVFTPDERLDYRRAELAKDMQAAIVTALPENEEGLGEVTLCIDARIPTYNVEDPRIEPSEWQCGEIGYAILSESGVTVVSDVKKSREPLESDGRPIVQGWIKLTGKTIYGKKHERFFYYPAGEPQTATFDWDRMQDYNVILKEQIADEKRRFKTGFQHSRLTVGDLVYVRLSDDEKEVLDISLVKVPRLKYRSALKDLLPEHLHPCEHYDALCPACRTFGWVKHAHQRSKTIEDESERVAYASRVRFSMAELVEDAGVYEEELALAILSSPKPTTGLFYLLEGDPEQESAKLPEGNKKISYKDGYRLRGRKFYLHHGEQLNRQEFERKAFTRQGQEVNWDHQNRSVRGVRAPGNVFRFTIHFENMTPIELGALLWSLELDGQGVHRLGYGKSLGFGSVSIQYEEIQVVDWKERFNSLDGNGGWHDASLKPGKWIPSFMKAMEKAYGAPFYDLANIKDLLSILSVDGASLPVHYPRSSREPNPQGKNFEWFVGNRKQEEPFALPWPDDTEGLPLLDKHGNEVHG